MNRRKIPRNGRPARTEASMFGFSNINFQKLLESTKQFFKNLRFKNSK